MSMSAFSSRCARGMEQVDKHESDSLHHIEQLGDDVFAGILKFLKTPIDIARVAAVSQFWRQIVIESRLWRDICIRQFPEIQMFESVALGVPNQELPTDDVRQPFSPHQLLLEHQTYSTLQRQFSKEPCEKSCILKSLHASSTDNLANEGIEQTLYPRSRFFHQLPSYWSSKGQISPHIPESLTYELITPMCVVQEISIRPFRAYFQRGKPIYSTKFVRFRMGYSTSRCNMKESSTTCTPLPKQAFSEDHIWTYTSPEFPMVQADTLQRFKLEPPVLCIGGVLQIELLERVQTQETDNLYYICICHVNVVGIPIQDFNFEVVEGKLILLKEGEQKSSDSLPPAIQETDSLADGVPSERSNEHSLAARIQQLRAFGFLRHALGGLDDVIMDDLLLNEDEEIYDEEEEETMHL